jgi:hypothetical protein
MILYLLDSSRSRGLEKTPGLSLPCSGVPLGPRLQFDAVGQELKAPDLNPDRLFLKPGSFNHSYYP